LIRQAVLGFFSGNSPKGTDVIINQVESSLKMIWDITPFLKGVYSLKNLHAACH